MHTLINTPTVGQGFNLDRCYYTAMVNDSPPKHSCPNYPTALSAHTPHAQSCRKRRCCEGALHHVVYKLVARAAAQLNPLRLAKPPNCMRPRPKQQLS